MAQLFINQNLIANVNIISHLPLPLFKLVIDWIEGLLYNYPSATLLTYNKLQQILFNQGLQMKIKEPIETVSFILKVALKGKFPIKILKTLFQQNTLIDELYLEYLLLKYQQMLQASPNQLTSGKLVQNSWAIYSLKSYDKNKEINKMYVKVSFKTQHNTEIAINTMTMTLSQFLILLQQTEKVSSSLNR